MYRASITRASSGDIDNTPIIDKAGLRWLATPAASVTAAADAAVVLLRQQPCEAALLFVPPVETVTCLEILLHISAQDPCFSAGAGAAPGEGGAAGLPQLCGAVHGLQGELN